ncbi:MAG: metal ABC transporter ATP-binding protein [Halobacteriales archaeon]|nr:metal ABC transporter ATP-binding protein [Halobacteriales archaeon]
MKAVELDDVSYSYGKVPAVEDVTLTIDESDYLGLVGPNGSGKSTLLKIMLGILEPDEGTARLFGETATKFDDGERIGYVGQNATKVDNRMPITVKEVVRMGRYPRVGRRGFSDEDRRAVDDAMGKTGVEDLASRRVTHLSGGQRQRVFIARALSAEADLLALDEPTVGVDAESREGFYDLLRELNENGMTVILIEHDIGVVTEYADEIACINRRLYFHGDPSEFEESDALTEAYGANQRVLEHDHSHDHG